MSQLVPCPSCGRHVRLSGESCPFCDAALDTSALAAQYAPRRGSVQTGIKRAVIFAVGASMAAACGGETEENPPDPDPTVQPVYGAPIEPSASETGETSNPPSEPTAQPLYGAPVTTDDEPTFAQPEYGAPVPPATTGIEDLTDIQAIYGAPVPPEDAGADAAAGDAGADADVPDQPTAIDPDPGPTVQPLYGAPALN